MTRGLGQALLRGRAMAAFVRIEDNGIPIDVPTLQRLRAGWDTIKQRLIDDIDADFGVFEDGSFRAARFTAYLVRNGIAWPRLPSGQLDLEDDTFGDMCKSHPELNPLHELKKTLSSMRLNRLTVGTDGRNRTILSAFGAVTGRNTPSNAKFVFGPARWLRGLIKPGPGFGVSYLDWRSQEVGILAALSGDEQLIEAYRSDDVYIAFARQSGLAPSWATRDTHPEIREQCKVFMLGIGYGMGAYTLAARLGRPTCYSRRLIGLYRDTYSKACEWLEAAIDTAMTQGCLRTVFGWPLHVGPPSTDKKLGQLRHLASVRPLTLRNFPCQGNGGEMLRLALCLGVERGVRIIAPVHDAIMLESPADQLADDIATMLDCMAEASRVVLDGFELLTSKPKPIVYPDRYMDERGVVMWQKTMARLNEVSTDE
jgi:DNA polymerase I